MTADEFAEAMKGGSAFEVCVRGYVVGSTWKRGFATDSRSPLQTVEPLKGSLCAEVRIEGAEVQNFDTSFAGTSLTIEKHGGGVIRVPIELLVPIPEIAA